MDAWARSATSRDRDLAKLASSLRFCHSSLEGGKVARPLLPKVRFRLRPALTTDESHYVLRDRLEGVTSICHGQDVSGRFRAAHLQPNPTASKTAGIDRGRLRITGSRTRSLRDRILGNTMTPAENSPCLARYRPPGARTYTRAQIRDASSTAGFSNEQRDTCGTSARPLSFDQPNDRILVLFTYGPPNRSKLPFAPEVKRP